MSLFRPDGSGFILNVSTTSARSTAGQLDANSSSIYIYNESAVPVCIRLGKSAVVATLNDLCLPPGSCQTFNKDLYDYIAAICASGSGILHIQGGSGE